MATENFIGYTETDPDTVITVAASKVSWVQLERNSDAYVYDDKGAAHFGGDFDHKLDVQITTGIADGGAGGFWALTNSVNDWAGLVTASADGLRVYWYRGAGPVYYIGLTELDAGTEYEDSWNGASLDTTYYLRIKRDESVGTYGTIYCGIYSTSGLRNAGDGTDGDVDNLAVTLHTSKKDFRYVFAVMSSNTGDNDKESDGFSENLDLQEATDLSINVSDCKTVGDRLV
jgi:hypothetical protein